MYLEFNEILLSFKALAIYPVTCACLELTRAKHGRNTFLSSIFLDTYVKVVLISPIGKPVAKSKTTIRRSMTDPEYNESFVFQMSQRDLAEVTLQFSVVAISRTRKKKEIVGWFHLGKNNSGQEETLHWNELMQAEEKSVSRWHVLFEDIKEVR